MPGGYCENIVRAFQKNIFVTIKIFTEEKKESGIKNKIFIAEGMAENFRAEGTVSWF